MLITLISLLISSNLWISCEKISNTPCGKPSCDTTKIDTPNIPIDTQLIWQTSFNENVACISMYPILYENEIIYSKRATVQGEPYLFVNKKNGLLINEINNDKVSTSAKGSQYQFANFLAIGYGNNVQVLDLDKRLIRYTWNSRDMSENYETMPRIGGYDKYVLMSRYSTATIEDEYTQYMVRSNMELGNLDTLFSITDTTCFRAGFERPTIWRNPKTNDSIIIFQNRQYRFGSSQCAPNSVGWGRVDIYAYNLTKRKMEWMQSNVTPETGNSSARPINIHLDKVFFQGDKHGILIDCESGKIVWRRFFQNESFMQTNSIIAEGKVLLKSETSNMIALDFESGNIVWENLEAGHSNSNMIYHKGNVYYETGQDGRGVLRGLRISDGKVIWTYFPRNGSNSDYGLSGIVIDPETDFLYTSDKKYMQCIRLPK